MSHVISSTSEALSQIPNHTSSNEDIIKIYKKIQSQFDINLNGLCFSRIFLNERRPVIILFEYNATDTKIFWRLSGNEFYVLEIHEDVEGILSLYCANFIANEMKNNNSGK